MSFHRVGFNHHKKVPGRRRPAWDDTVNDLTVLKATPEEVLHRKEVHKSKHHLSVKLEKLHQERKAKSKMSAAEAQQLAIIKEVLYDQQQLQNVLAKSDSMMAVVKDLFGDDPKRYMGFPNVTTAPSCQDYDSSSDLVASVPDIYTRSEKLSDSVMNQSALNDVDFSLSSDSDDSEVDRPKPISYESKMNLQRFQEYLKEEEKKTAHMDPIAEVAMLNRNQSAISQLDQSESLQGIHSQDKLIGALAALLGQEQKKRGSQDLHSRTEILASEQAMAAGYKANGDNDGLRTPPRDQRSPVLQFERTPPSAMNDTKKVKKTKKCTVAIGAESDAGNSTANMNDMRKVLDDLEKEIGAYEVATGRCRQQEIKRTDTFSGYTTALVSSISRLTRYLKETELRVQAESMLREQLSQDVSQLKAIIDAVATDIIVTQEEYAKLASEHMRYKETTQNELILLKNQVKDLQKHVFGAEISSSRQNQNYTDYDTSRRSEGSKTSTPVHKGTNPELKAGIYQTEEMTQLAAAAVMLSPPVRKTRVPTVHDVNKFYPSIPPSSQHSLVDACNLSAGVSTQQDPPQLTQAPPITSTVNVPRPVPLVQTNMTVPLSTSRPQPTHASGQTKESLIPNVKSQPLATSDLSDLVKLEDETEQQMRQLQELVMEEAFNNPDLQQLMQTQIAELNRQQEEAKKRLKDLLDHQKHRQQNMQDPFNLHLTRQPQSRQTNFSSASPPISPIPQQQDKPQRVKVLGDKSGHQIRQLKVAVPQVGMDKS